MKCWGCEYFKIIQEPLRVGKDIYDLGRAECTNFDLIVDFINHGKLKRLECIDETMGERKERIMEYRAQMIVLDYINKHLDKSDNITDFGVYTVWKCKALQNWKFLISSTLLDGMYYELTFNGDKSEWYLDAYKKFENQVIPERREPCEI